MTESERKLINLDELFDEDVKERAEYYICYDLDYEDEPYPPGDTPREAIENYLSEVGPFGYKLDETFECHVAAFVDTGEEEIPPIASCRVRLSLTVTKIKEGGLNER